MAAFYWIDPTGLLGWDNVGAWSFTSGGSPNGSTPSAGDDVFFDANSPSAPATGPSTVSLNSLDTTAFTFGPLPSLANVTITGSITLADVSTFDGTYSGTPTGTFSNGSINQPNSGTLGVGNFNGTAYNSGSGTVTTGTFNNASINDGTVTTATFNNTSQNGGTVTTATFNNTSQNNGGSVTTATFNGSSSNLGNVVTAIFNSNSSNETGTVTNGTFNGSSNNNGGTVTGVLTVDGTVAGDYIVPRLNQNNLGDYATLHITGLPSGGSDVFGVAV